MSATRRLGDLLGGLLLVLMVVVVMIPFLGVVSKSFDTSAMSSIGDVSAWARILGSSRTWRIVGVTVGQALVSSAVTVAVGVPVAFCISRFRFPGRSLVVALAMVPFVLPSVVVGAAFGSIFGASGFFDARGSWWLIIAAHLCFNLAVVMRSVGAAFDNDSRDAESVARMLGCSPLRAFIEVTVPRIIPSVLASATIVFLFCLTSFGVVVMLGGGAVTVLEVEIWVRATRQFDLSGAAVLSVIQMVAVVATLGTDWAIGRSRKSIPSTGPGFLVRPAGKREWLLVGASSVGVLAISGVPLGALVIRSLQVPGGLGLDNWTNLGSVLSGTDLAVSPIRAATNSLSTALIVTMIAVVVAFPVARFVANRRGRIQQSVVLVPLGVSATTIGLGLLIAFGRPPVDLRQSGLLIPVAQLLVAVPLVTRVLIPGIRAVDRSQLEGAAVLGTSPSRRFWRVELPLVSTVLRAAAALGFVACIGEFGATVFVARSDRVTLPVLLAELMSRPGGAGYGQAMAIAVVMVVICGGIITVAERLGRSGGDVIGWT